MRTKITRARALGTLLAACALIPAFGASSAGAATTTANACRYSVDDYWRDLDVTVNGTAATVTDASGRFITPGTVIPGQTVKLSGATVDAALPSWMPEYGYNTGLLVAGENTIPTKVWLAVKATNTKEGTQTVGPIAVTAKTTITVDAKGNFLSATPILFNAPTIPDIGFTATGGDVTLAQAGGGAFKDKLPVGPSGSLQSVLGSFVVVADVNGAKFGLDCQPGHSTDAGGAFAKDTAPTLQTIGGPLNNTCLSGLGRQVSGTNADLNAGYNRELDGITVRFDGTGTPTSYTPGQSFGLTGAKVRVTIPDKVARVLGRYIYSNGIPLAYADKTYQVIVWVAIKGNGTTQGTQTVKLPMTYSLHPHTPVPSGGTQKDVPDWAPVVLEGTLPTTTWTAASGGPVSFQQGDPGSMDKITVIGKTEPAFDDYPYDVNPYGSVFVRASTERYGESLDCLPGAVTNIDTSVSWSNLGRANPPFGSGGRYTIAANPAQPVFASLSAAPAGVAPTPPTTTTVPTPTTPATGTLPTVVTKPTTVARAGASTVATTKLTVSAGKVKLAVSCSSAGPCRGIAQIKTNAKVRVGKTSKIVTITTARSYSLVAGKTETYSLALSKDAKTLLGRVRSVKVKIALKPSAGKVTSRLVTLSR